MDAAIEIYRTTFKPSEQLEKPHLMLGFNICAAPTDEEAVFLRSSSLQSFVNLRRGTPGQLPPPLEGYEESLTPSERLMVEEIGRCSAVGSPQTVENKVGQFITETGADELMIVCSIFDHGKRIRSYEIAGEMFNRLKNENQSQAQAV